MFVLDFFFTFCVLGVTYFAFLIARSLCRTRRVRFSSCEDITFRFEEDEILVNVPISCQEERIMLELRVDVHSYGNNLHSNEIHRFDVDLRRGLGIVVLHLDLPREIVTKFFIQISDPENKWIYDQTWIDVVTSS